MGVIALGFYGLLDYNRYQAEEAAEQQPHTADQERIAGDEIANECLALVPSERGVCIRRKVAAYREAERSEKDLKAQQNMVRVAFWMASLTWVQALIGIGGIYYVSATLRQAIKQDEGAKQALEVERASARAHLIVNWCNADLIGDGTPEDTSFEVENAGQTVAKSVLIRVSWAISNDFMVEPAYSTYATAFRPSWPQQVSDVVHVKLGDRRPRPTEEQVASGYTYMIRIELHYYDIFREDHDDMIVYWKDIAVGQKLNPGTYDLKIPGEQL